MKRRNLGKYQKGDGAQAAEEGEKSRCGDGAQCEPLEPRKLQEVRQNHEDDCRSAVVDPEDKEVRGYKHAQEPGEKACLASCRQDASKVKNG